VALSELYKWTTTWLAACFPSFMACLLARQEGSKQKPTKDDRYRKLNVARNCPREQLVLTRDADPTFFNAVKNEHFLRHGSRSELPPDVMVKFVPLLRKQAKLKRKRTGSLDNTNRTGILDYVSALNSANAKVGDFVRYGSVDSDIVDYVNQDELAGTRIKTIKRKRRSRRATPRPPPHPSIQPIDEALPSAPLMANMGTEMVDIAVPTLEFVEAPRIPPPPQARREARRETVKRI
jgi:hypothetical protein